MPNSSWVSIYIYEETQTTFHHQTIAIIPLLCPLLPTQNNLLTPYHRAWEKFNGRTKMMKGLFNYEKAYRTYTRALLKDFARDNIQYAEIRPNFMTENQLWSDDGVEQ